MIINKYKFTYDSDFYITGFYTVEQDYDYEGQLAGTDVTNGYTRFRDGQFIIDEEKKAEIIAERQKQERISELKAYLNSTDYIYAKCTETGEDVNVVYADVVEQRKSARKEIQELED